MTDWLRAIGRGADPETSIIEVMVNRPVSITREDNGAVAAAVLREHNLKSLPVVEWNGRRLAGCLRVRRLLAHIFSNAARLERALAERQAAAERVATES
jgi:CBS-domain-containing membrane protein